MTDVFLLLIWNSVHWISSPDLDLDSVSSVSQTGKLCSWTLLTHTSTELLSKSLRRSATMSRWIPSQSFLSLKANDGAYAWLAEMVIKCVRAVEGRYGKREWARECDFVPHWPSWDSTCVEAWYSTSMCVVHTLCVWTQHVLHECVFFFFCGVQANKISLPSAVLWLSFGPSLRPVFLPARST